MPYSSPNAALSPSTTPPPIPYLYPPMVASGLACSQSPNHTLLGHRSDAIMVVDPPRDPHPPALRAPEKQELNSAN